MILENTYKFLAPNPAEIVMLYIYEHLDENFIFSRTYNQIQKDTGVSQPTIAKVFEAMEEVGAAKHIGKSKWSLAGVAMRWVDEPSDFRGFYVEAKDK